MSNGWWMVDRLRAWGGEQPDRDLRVGRDDRKFLNDAADEIEALRSELTTIAEHWPGKWTGYCCACDDEAWPCQTVLDVVVPWMVDEANGSSTGGDR